jgi:hypothetical protein
VALKTVFRFRNPDSTSDLNRAYASAIGKGIYDGGDVGISPTSLNLTISPFTAVGFDGMIVTSDTPVTLTAHADVVNVVCLFAKYEQNSDPVLRLDVLPSTSVIGSDLEDYFIIFATIDLTDTPINGWLGLTYESPSAPPARTGVVSFATSNYGEKINHNGVKSAVQNEASLPTQKNSDGDLRYSIADKVVFAWDSATATWINTVGSSAATVTYAGGPSWLDGVANPATTVEDQLDKIITDLITDGGSKIKVPAISGSPTNISTSVSLTSALTTLLAGINARGVLGGVNIWTQENTFNDPVTFTDTVTSSGAVTLSNGITVSSGGASIRGGVTLPNGSLTLTTGGITASAGTITGKHGVFTTSLTTPSLSATNSTLTTLNSTTATISTLTSTTATLTNATITNLTTTLPSTSITEASIATTISSDQTAWSPTGWASSRNVYVSMSAVHRIHGISITSLTEKYKRLVNYNSNALILKHESVSASSTTRLKCPNAADFVIPPWSSVDIVYDAHGSSGDRRWIVIAGGYTAADIYTFSDFVYANAKTSTQFVNVGYAAPVNTGWSVGPALAAATGNANTLGIPIDHLLKDGATIDSFTAYVYPGIARPTSSNRMGVYLARKNMELTIDLLSTTYRDNGSTGGQAISGLATSNNVVDKSLYTYLWVVVSGNNAATYSDTVSGGTITQTYTTIV